MKKLYIQLLFILSMIILWQLIYQLNIFPKIMFPSSFNILKSLFSGFMYEGLGKMVLYSLSLILKGLLLGMFLSFILSSLSILSKTIYAIYSMLICVFDLIPGIALIPLAILWFGIGEKPTIFIVVHSILWPMSRSIIDGFHSVPTVYIESARNIGITGFDLIKDIYIPASLSNVLSGMKTGWARAWRGLISAEMVFGTTSSGAGIGWFIFMKRTNVDISGVFASLIVIIIIGLIVEYGFFHCIERNTIKKWGI